VLGEGSEKGGHPGDPRGDGAELISAVGSGSLRCRSDAVAREVEVVDWFSTSATPGRLILVGVILFFLALSPWVGRALVTLVHGAVDCTKLLLAGKVMTDLAKLDAEQAERLRTRLERIRPPQPDEIEPPAASSG
jgi:hypothetical protein